MEYGYCRISTPKQNIDRQVRNILQAYPNAKIYKEVYTGTKTTGRKKLEEIVKLARSGDTIIFDSVSRMSRNADEGVGLYMQLYDEGVNLVFIKEPHINTATYSKALSSAEGLSDTGNRIADEYIKATRNVLSSPKRKWTTCTAEPLRASKLHGETASRLDKLQDVSCTSKKPNLQKKLSKSTVKVSVAR